MKWAAATAPGNDTKPSEDWYHASEDLIVVLDGATARTDTGCVHGIAWYTHHLGAAIVDTASDPDRPLRTVLADAITAVARLHSECDLTAPGTPSAGVGIVRVVGGDVQWLVLGDVTVLLDTSDGLQAHSDTRIRSTVARARREAHRWPIGTPEKARALIGMKHQELAARNRLDGYWIAAADPTAARHSLTGTVPAPALQQAAVLTDGLERLVTLFKAVTWRDLLTIAAQDSPQALIDQVRDLERDDPLAVTYQRNKCSDDATVVWMTDL